jgi:SAM-dependent methyltransferase
MNPELQRLQHVLRELRLLRLVEGLRFWMSIARCSRRNAQFIRRNPDFVLPPRHLAYDAYSAPDWTYYKNSGEETAMFLADIIRTHSGNSNEARVLEWGCGPGRVIRHMPETLGQKTGINGADYNKESIQWLQRASQWHKFRDQRTGAAAPV